MKHEWKKSEKELYMPKAKPEKLSVPKYKYFVIEGNGQIGDSSGICAEDFKDRAEVLNRVSNAIKNMPKRGFYPGGYFEYIPYPLEMLIDSVGTNYKLMIRQPEFVTSSVARMAVTSVVSANPHPLINEVSFVSVEDGNSVQLMHVGTNEKGGIDLLIKFIEENELKRRNTEYKKIFINDPIKTEPSKLKTVIRLMVQ